MKYRKFFTELSRRNVFKATIAYLAVAWVIIQIASIVLPTFDLPEYTLKILIYGLSIGLIFWIAFSWAYDLTSEGFQKNKDVVYNEETVKRTNKRLNRVIAVSIFIAVMLLISVSFWAGSQWNEGFTKVDVKKIAVTPFVLKGDSTQSYFEAGMTDALIVELSKVDQLKVINQASTKVFSANLNPTNVLVSNELKQIEYFITGFIERQLNNLKIHVQLKKSFNVKPIWEKNYAKDISEVKILWADVANDLTRQMGIVVKQAPVDLSSNLRSIKPETYELYLKGKHALSKSTLEECMKGIVYLEEAIDKNPSDSYAYSGLAEGYIMLAHGPSPPPNVISKAHVSAQRAIQLDSTNAEGWASLAHYHTYFGWDWKLAEYAFERANELNPNMAYNHYHRAWFLALFGQMNEAIEEHILAQELDPFTPLHTAWLGELYRMVGLYDEGLAEVEKVTDMEYGYALGMLIKGRIFMDQGKTNEALELMKQASLINPGWKYFGYGPALIQAGHIEEGKAIIQELESLPTTAFGALCLGIMYTELGEIDKALDWYEYEKKHAWYASIRIYTKNRELLHNERFLKLIREMNLPDPAPLVFTQN